METPETTAEKAKNPNEAVIMLDTPIKRGETTHDSITLRKVLPRISTPSLTDHEIGAMDPADLMACGVAVSGFLLQKSAKEAVLVA